MSTYPAATFVFVFFMMFLTGLIDSIAGGGGLISLPTYYAVGLDPHLAAGTNKFTATFGTLIAAIKYVKAKKYELQVAILSIIGSFIGASVGTYILLLIDKEILKKIFLVLLPIIAVFVLINRNLGTTNEFHTLPKKKVIIYSLLIGIVVGFYDGFFGPGAGTFFTILFTTVLKLDLTTAAGNARLANLASNLASISQLFVAKEVVFVLAIPGAMFNILGNYIGSSLAMKKGAKIIRPLMFVVLVLLIITLFLQNFNISLPFLKS